jgi:hypothetical protein
MKFETFRFYARPGSRGKIRRRVQGRLVDLQRAVENIEDGIIVSCPPRPLATMLIRRIEKRGVFQLGSPVSHVR